MDVKPDFGEESYKGFGRLKDKVAIITGADSGIGRAVALAYAREGADVAICFFQHREDAQETERVVRDAGREALLVQADLSKPDECQRAVKETVDRFGRVDLLVNNAAFQGKSVESFEEISTERVELTFRTNILAMFELSRLCLPHMRPGSAIINVASIQGYDPSPGILDYASTKGAIITFTKGLAQHLIERGIRVNCVAPGPVWTPLIVQSFDQEKVQKFGESNPMKRPAQPAELAPAFVFLGCDESRFVVGEILGVTGGHIIT
jgi:NAD(P)-dependent dehydrogenase (short-subunit alcohol dehydrogenase family)